MKPDPVCALECAEAVGIESCETAFVEDTGTDMETSVNAGMYGIGVLRGSRDADELFRHGAKLLISSQGEIICNSD